MPAAEIAYEEQARIIEAAVMAAADTWGRLDPAAINASWVQQRVGDRLALSLSRAQELAAVAADVATDLILLEDGIEVSPDGDVVPASLAGVAADGRDLDGLLLQPLITAQAAVASGIPPAEALLAGKAALTRIVGTEVADAGRAAGSLGIAARPRTGWVRMVESRACSRCIILAGRWYRWSASFNRHPLCKCRHIPAAEDTPRLTSATDPMTAFNALSEVEQNKQFTKAGAQAIRDGADINRVVNARRGAMGLRSPGALTRDERRVIVKGGRLEKTNVFGQDVYITSDGITTRSASGRQLIRDSGSDFRRLSGQRRNTTGRAPRLMPESIYELAKDRDDAVRLLKAHGYLVDRSGVDAANAAARRAREAYAASRAQRGL